MIIVFASFVFSAFKGLHGLFFSLLSLFLSLSRLSRLFLLVFPFTPLHAHEGLLHTLTDSYGRYYSSGLFSLRNGQSSSCALHPRISLSYLLFSSTTCAFMFAYEQLISDRLRGLSLSADLNNIESKQHNHYSLPSYSSCASSVVFVVRFVRYAEIGMRPAEQYYYPSFFSAMIVLKFRCFMLQFYHQPPVRITMRLIAQVSCSLSFKEFSSLLE